MRRNILITGATGKQGNALIRALTLQSSSDSTHQYHIYALTRSKSSQNAQCLTLEKHVTVVEGDLDVPDSITKIFEEVKSEGGIWGVYAVLAYPGLGKPADIEEKQGKSLADIALRFGVSSYVYSSAITAGPNHYGDLKFSHLAKHHIEEHCKILGESGLPWTILRPSFFMDNLDGLVGSITVGVLKTGLKPDTALALIASEDIGNVAAAVFKDHQAYKHQVLTLRGDELTMRQQEVTYKQATGHRLSNIPRALAWFIVRTNKNVQELNTWFEVLHFARASGEYPEIESEVQNANKAYKMRSLSEWASQEHQSKKDSDEPWNKVSIWKIVTGRS